MSLRDHSKASKLKSIKPLFLLLFIVIYLLLTIIYLLPANPLKNKIPDSVFRYYSVFFDQNWNLFGNTLVTNHLTIDYSCENKTWRVFGDGELNRHKNNRLIGAGKMLYALDHITKKLLSDIYTSGDFSDSAIRTSVHKNRYYSFLEEIIRINCLGHSAPYRYRITINEQEKIMRDGLRSAPVSLILFEDQI